MAYRLPTFNVRAYVWRGPQTIPPVGSPALYPFGNLTPGRRVTLLTPSGTPVMYLLLPMGTDIRSDVMGGSADVVEVPAGTGRYYDVLWVDNVATGFSNEHVLAVLAQKPTWSPPPGSSSSSSTSSTSSSSGSGSHGTCLTAETVSLGSLTDFIASGSIHWYSFGPMSAFVAYHIRTVTMSSGLQTDCLMRQGSCSEADGAIPTPGNCFNVVLSADGRLLVKIDNTTGSGETFTIDVDAGVC